MLIKTHILLAIILSLIVSALAPPSAARSACATPVFINELHYDNVGADVDEFIEIAGPAGLDLSGWTLVLYNGNDGKPYGSPMLLDGVIAAERDGMGALAFAAPGIQNGSPDGVALVDDMGAVRDLISYEGSFVATSGPAVGLALADIGVAEGTNSPIGQSLQRTGIGACMDEFIWDGPTPASPGLLNAGQFFSALPRVLSVEPADGRYDAARDAQVLVTFSKAVIVVGQASIECTKSGLQRVTPTRQGENSFLLPHTDFIGGETCVVTLPASMVFDTDEAQNSLADDYSWQFAVAYTPTEAAALFISAEELHSRAVVDAQDDFWRAAAQEASSCPNLITGVLQEAKSVQCGDREGDCMLPTVLGSGLTISYTLRNMDGHPLGSADAWASGHGDGCNGGATLQDGAPRPNGVPGCYYNDAGNLRGSNSSPNAVLFTFSKPVSAFGAWFGDLETKPFGVDYYRDGAGGGAGSGGAQAYLRIFFEDGSMQEAPIEPTLAPSGPWLSADAPPPALPLNAGGDVAFCGGPTAATDADGCGNSTTRWVSFVSDDPQRRVTQMLVAVGDDDHSGAGPSDGPNVVCEGGDGGTCNGGAEYLSFIGPTVCAAPDLSIAMSVEPAAVRAGGFLTYTVAFSNLVSGFDTGPITVTAHLPEGFRFLETIASDPTATLAATTPQWRIERLPDGATGYITFVAETAVDVAGPVSIGATIDTAGDANLANNYAEATVFVASPRIELGVLINGQDSDYPPGPAIDVGDPLMWTYTIVNTGNVALTDLLLTVDGAPGPSCLEGALPAWLLPGETAICTVAGMAELGLQATHAEVTATPLVGLSSPVSATATSHYTGAGYGVIEIVLLAEPQLAQGFTFTASMAASFVLVDAQDSNHVNSMTFPHVRAGSVYTFTVAHIEGWLLESITCSVEETGASTGDVSLDSHIVAVTPSAGATITCVFAVRATLPVLTVVSTVVNDDGGAATEAEFLLLTNGQPIAAGAPVTLSPGLYTVTIAGPPGYTRHFGGDCDDAGVVPLMPGAMALCTVAHDDHFASVGDRVWLDEVRNGVQDVHEPGVRDVTVWLYDPLGEVITQTVTNQEGYYQFVRLLPGDYMVGFSLPEGYAFTSQHAGDDTAIDSDANPLIGRTGPITLGPSEHLEAIDVGLERVESTENGPADGLPEDEEPGDEEPASGEPDQDDPADNQPDDEPDSGDPGDSEPVEEAPEGETPSDGDDTDAPAQLQFELRASQSSLLLAPGATQVLTYTLRYQNLGPISATGVDLIVYVPRATRFHSAASSPGWQCVGAAGALCRYTIGELAAFTDETVTFALLIAEPAELIDAAVVIVAELRADGVTAGQAASAFVLEASAHVEVLHPTSLDEEDEPVARTHRLLLPWVVR